MKKTSDIPHRTKNLFMSDSISEIMFQKGIQPYLL